jgi:hypothetical protein
MQLLDPFSKKNDLFLEKPYFRANSEIYVPDSEFTCRFLILRAKFKFYVPNH